MSGGKRSSPRPMPPSTQPSGSAAIGCRSQSLSRRSLAAQHCCRLSARPAPKHAVRHGGDVWIVFCYLRILRRPRRRLKNGVPFPAEVGLVARPAHAAAVTRVGFCTSYRLGHLRRATDTSGLDLPLSPSPPLLRASPPPGIRRAAEPAFQR